MSKEALVPCLVCNKVLDNVMEDAENQPYEGTSFETHGHYGSTSFDPMNGSLLEINICDECLTQAGKNGKVLWRREANALVGAPPWPTSIFGWVVNPEAKYVKWNPDLDEIKEGHLEDERQDGLVKIPIDSKEELLELVETYGIRLNGGVKLNGGFTLDDIFKTEGEVP